MAGSFADVDAFNARNADDIACFGFVAFNSCKTFKLIKAYGLGFLGRRVGRVVVANGKIGFKEEETPELVLNRVETFSEEDYLRDQQNLFFSKLEDMDVAWRMKLGSDEDIFD